MSETLYKPQVRHTLSALVKDPRQFARRFSRQFRPMCRPHCQRFRMTLSQWLLYHQRDIIFSRCTWMGVRALKNPCDAWVYQEIICDVQPDIVVIGSKYGGSTLYLANLLDLLGRGTVISVDIDRTCYHIEHPRIITVTGDSSSSEVVAGVAELCEGKSVLVIHDSYFIVEDGVQDLFRPGDGIGTIEDGPLAAIDEFLTRNPHFVADRDRERYIITSNPQGFLKRIRS